MSSNAPANAQISVNYDKPLPYICLSCNDFKNRKIRQQFHAMEKSTASFMVIEHGGMKSPQRGTQGASAHGSIITSATEVGTALNGTSVITPNALSQQIRASFGDTASVASSTLSSASILSEMQQYDPPRRDRDGTRGSIASSDSWSPQTIDVQGRRQFTVNEIHDRHVQIEIPNGERVEIMDVTAPADDSSAMCLTCYENLMRHLEDEARMSHLEHQKHEKLRQTLLESQQRDQKRDANGRTEAENRKIRELEQELALMEQQCEKARQELQRVKKERRDLERKEESYWNVFFQTKERRHSTIAERSSMRRRLQMFKECTKYASTFSEKKMYRLWYDGSIVTINELRLGSLTHQVTPWEEINAAWGMCALLLHQLALWQGISFSMYAIHPQGSTSYIEHIDTGRTFPLYFKNMRSIAEFNTAMEAFLNCLKEFLEHPYFRENRVTEYHRFTTIDQHRIDGKSIRLATRQPGWGSKSEVKESDEWTSAVNNVVLTLKWLRREVKAPSQRRK